MAKGSLHLNVEFSAVKDEEGRFARLATLLGLADADHARGKCEHLWVACTRRGESDLPQWLVEQVLGAGGPDALIESGLAGWAGGRGDSKTRRLRIGGAEKHCMWMASDQAAKSEQSSKGGKTRAATASRAGGRFTSDPPASPPAQTSPSEITSEITSDPEDQNSPPRDPAVPSTAPSAQQPAATTAPPAADKRPDLPTRQAAKNALMGELGAARKRVAAAVQVVAQPLLAFDPGERDLADRIALVQNQADLETFLGQARHAIAMAEAETSSGAKSLEWFTGAIFAERNLRRLVGKTAADPERDQHRSRAGPRSSAERAPEPSRKIKTMT